MKRLSVREERFAENVVLRLMDARKAALDAGYSQSTIDKRGAKYLLDRPHVAARIDELRERGIESAVENLERSFSNAGMLVTEALATQADLMRNAESEAVRERASRALIEVGKGLLLAAHPKDSSFEAAMAALYEEAQRRVQEKRKESIEIKGEVVGDSDK